MPHAFTVTVTILSCSISLYLCCVRFATEHNHASKYKPFKGKLDLAKGINETQTISLHSVILLFLVLFPYLHDKILFEKKINAPYFVFEIEKLKKKDFFSLHFVHVVCDYLTSVIGK